MRVLVLVVLAGAVDAMGDAMCGGVVFTFLVVSLGGTADTFGAVQIAWGMAKTLGAWWMGYCTDKCHAKTTLVLSVAGSALGYLWIARAEDIPTLVVACVTSALFDGSEVLIARMVAEHVAVHQRASVFAFLSACTAACTAVVPVLGALLAQHVSLHAPFYAMAAIASMLLVVVLCRTPSRRGVPTTDGMARTPLTAARPHRLSLALLVLMEVTFIASAVFNNVTRTFLLKDVLGLPITESALTLSSENVLDALVGVAATRLLRSLSAPNVLVWAPAFMVLSSLMRILLVDHGRTLSTAVDVTLFVVSILGDCICGNFLTAVYSSRRTALVPLHRVGTFRAAVKTAVFFANAGATVLSTRLYTTDPQGVYYGAILSSVLCSLLGTVAARITPPPIHLLPTPCPPIEPATASAHLVPPPEPAATEANGTCDGNGRV